tara:strand:- start:12913 stop:13872 length:960 start_codon:yes stop_codon:yes gene_type:complete
MSTNNNELNTDDPTENVSLNIETANQETIPAAEEVEVEVEEEEEANPAAEEIAVAELNPTNNEETDYNLYLNHNNNINWFEQTEYIVFSNELKSLQRNNVIILKECKDNKRLLDLKYDDMNTIVNNIQTSVIFCSTLSGFIQATRIQLTIPDTVSSIFSITVATYISLILSISKYYKLDEIKEKIQILREKYSLLHNKLDHRMDVIGPWGAKNLWIHQDPVQKFKEWKAVCKELDEDYEDIIKDKQSLVTEFEIIMDTKSRNAYFIKNRQFNYANRELLYSWDKKETELERRIAKENVNRRPSSIKLQHEELDNWMDEV